MGPRPRGRELFMESNKQMVIIRELGMNGEGIAGTAEGVLFVPFTLPGEKVSVEIVHRKKNTAYGRAVAVLTPAEERVRPPCPVFGRCGGCQLQHLKYSFQIRLKTKLVREAFRKVAKLHVRVSECAKSGESYHYRNKLQIPVGVADGKAVCGFYAPDSHEIVPVRGCMLHPAWARDLTDILCNFLNEFRIRPYDERTGEGVVRHLVAREVGSTLMIVIVSARPVLPHAEVLVKRFLLKFPTSSVFLNLNDKPTNVVTGKQYQLLAGERCVKSSELGLTVFTHPNSFSQINTYVRNRIYQKVAALCMGGEEDVIVDAYSGAGLLTAYLTRCCGKVYGIEIVPEAVENANALAMVNGLTGKMENLLGDCRELLPPLVRRLRAEGRKVSVILDPPRKGCDPAVLAALAETQPERIVYISCNPSTLARDVGILVGTLNPDGSPREGLPPLARLSELEEAPEAAEGESRVLQGLPPESPYDLTFIRPYDMFPQTKHVETLVVLWRKNP